MRKPVYAICEQQGRSLISAFVVHWLTCIISILAKIKISSLQLVPIAKQTSLSSYLGTNHEERFSRDVAHFSQVLVLKMPLMAWRQPTLPGCCASGSRIKNRTDQCCTRKRNWFLTLSRTLNQKCLVYDSWNNTWISKCINQNIYILGVFTDNPYSKPLERNVVYISIISLSHAKSHDFKWRQNKPWLFTIWLDVRDVMTSLTLLRC